MKYAYGLFLGILLITMLGGCGTSNPVVATVGKEKITLDDFEKEYAKNNGGWASSVSSSSDDRERFLDLLVKFRLKVEEAKGRGLLQDSAVTGELNSYRMTVSQSYMLEKELIAPHVKQMYEHKLEDIHAAHIFFRLPPNPTPLDTLTAYNKAMKVDSLLRTVRFDTLAREYSEDPQSAPNGGDLGWLAPGRIPEDMEFAVYALKEGETSRVPFRSPYGYHIFKAMKREPAKGSFRISHILKRFAQDMKDTAAVRDTVWQIYNELQHGANFDSLARTFSDDAPTKDKGGDLGFYSRENVRPNIANFLFNLPLDSVSVPFHQPYGYHIFKITERRGVPPFSDMEKDLRADYQQRFYQQDYTAYVANLKHLYPVVLDSTVEKELGASFDTTKTMNSPGWSDTLSSSILSRTLLTCAGKPFSVRDFVEQAENISDIKEILLKPSNIGSIVNRVAEAAVLQQHASTAVDRYPQLKSLMDEYLDGILLYRIEQDEVWKRVVANDSLLRMFYDTTREKYRWPDRVNFAEIFVTSDSARKEVQWKLSYGEDFLSVAEEYTARAGYRDKLGMWGLQSYDLNELSKKAAVMPVDSVSDFFPFQSGWSIIKVMAKDGPRVKTFEEAGPEVASSYQEQASKVREQEWLDSLKQKYGVVIDNALLTQAFKKKPLETN